MSKTIPCITINKKLFLKDKEQMNTGVERAFPLNLSINYFRQNQINIIFIYSE